MDGFSACGVVRYSADLRHTLRTLNAVIQPHRKKKHSDRNSWTHHQCGALNIMWKVISIQSQVHGIKRLLRLRPL